MDELGERILDAAVEAASIHGITRLSVADVARRAGLSRPTLYKRYPSKNALVSAAIVREAARVIEAVQQAVDAVDPSEGGKAALIAGIGTALRLLREHPLLDRIVRTEPETLVPALTTDDGLVLSVVRPPIEAMIADHFEPLDPVTSRRVADMLTRLLISYALNAPDDPPEVVAAVVAAVMVDGASSLVTGHTHREGNVTTAEPVPAPAPTWRDPKRRWWLGGLLVPLLPFVGAWLASLTGWNALWWMGPIWILLIIPALDTLWGTDDANPPDWAIAQLEADRYYRWCVYLYLPLQYLGFVWAASVFVHGDLSPLSKLGLALTVGTVAGIGINTAHELGHKRERIERRLSKVALAQTGYGHFYVEHNRGHHARVSTPEDPASARLGESFWAFLPRTVAGSLRSAWSIAAGGQRRKGKRVWSLSNDVLNAWALSVVLFGATIAAFGPAVVPFVVVQAIFGFSLLEVVNYIEHYGLLRQTLPNGRYERCRPEHSWNSNNLVSNLLLYHLERHSDHHANPTRRYQSLRHFEEAPQLPSGYALMMGLAYVPPVWRRVMDHRVLAHYGGDVSRANIHPPRRQQVLARYATTTG